MLVSPKVVDAPLSGGWGRPGSRGPGRAPWGRARRARPWLAQSARRPWARRRWRSRRRIGADRRGGGEVEAEVEAEELETTDCETAAGAARLVGVRVGVRGRVRMSPNPNPNLAWPQLTTLNLTLTHLPHHARYIGRRCAAGEDGPSARPPLWWRSLASIPTSSSAPCTTWLNASKGTSSSASYCACTKPA